MLKISIRPLEVGDAYTSVKWRNIPEIWKFTGSAPNREISIEDELKWIRAVIADSTCKRFAIIADENYIGNIYLTGIEDGVAEYHIFIGEKDYWGKGVAQKASRLLIDYGKNKLHLKTIELKVREDNKSALHLYKKIGFNEVGVEGEFIKMAMSL